MKRNQLSRLIQILVLLQNERYPNARDLAEHCEVSRRTIYRDLDALEASGIPIRFHDERLGYGVAPSFQFQPPGLDDGEILALAILAKTSHNLLEPLGLQHAARIGSEKLLKTISAAMRDRAASILDAIETSIPERETPEQRRRHLGRILECLGERKQVRIAYQDPRLGSIVTTKFAVYRLLHHAGAPLDEGSWLVVGRSSIHCAIEHIALNWIHKIDSTDDTYSVPPRFDASRRLASDKQSSFVGDSTEIRLAFSQRAARRLFEFPFAFRGRIEPVRGGGIEASFAVDSFAAIVPWLFRFPGGVRIIAPDSLRAHVRECASRLIAEADSAEFEVDYQGDSHAV
jgi:predicted DNA-binding transcriptional regulator YafY